MARSNFSIYSALVSNILIAAAKFAAGSVSRSSAMISEGIHSSVDCFNELFLLIGIHKSNRKRDKVHPFGYGRELYLWSFLVAIIIFGFGAITSFVQGYLRLTKPVFPGDLFWND
ncbi:MAG TPA: cation transporter, partial [Puia sp.]|nr:cation transporter [Puia sp.]